MAFQSNQLHFVVFPFMAPGHMNPMMDVAKLLAQQGAIITIVTTPHNAKRFATNVARAVESGLQMKFIEVQMKLEEAGLPIDCENVDLLPSLRLAKEFLTATSTFQAPVEILFEELTPRPNCIISDALLPYTANVASKFHIPRISFNGTSCFANLCFLRIQVSGILDSITSDSERVTVPGMPGHFEFTKDQLPWFMFPMEYINQIIAAEAISHGRIINSFQELESKYIQQYKRDKEDGGYKVWCVGPVSLCNKDNTDRLHRGNKASIDESQLLKWLDLQQPASVIYVCLGSLCNLITSQMIVLGLGLDASGKPFIWAISGGEKLKGQEKWLAEDDFEDKIKGRGLLIQGWAPWVLVLSHHSLGGFYNHCCWNSILEEVYAGVPMVPSPLFLDQFFNEKLVLEVLQTGVDVGATSPIKWREDERIGVLVKKECVRKAVDKLMKDGEESKERKERAKHFNELAREAMKEEGSSCLNLKQLMKYLMEIIFLIHHPST
uniref:Uncharacterized protein MANES_08G015600 n=1 Tax=Rhizophora mucronata TaxID=61149 RepID=A0A2P2IRD9_RHIMU